MTDDIISNVTFKSIAQSLFDSYSAKNVNRKMQITFQTVTKLGQIITLCQQ